MINLDELEKAAFPEDHPVSYQSLREAVYATRWGKGRAVAASGSEVTEVDAATDHVIEHTATCELCRHRMSMIQAADPALNDRIRAGVADLAVQIVEQEAQESAHAPARFVTAAVAGVTAAIVT